MTVSEEKKRDIYRLGQQIPVLSDREIARRLKISRDSVARYRGNIPTEGVSDAMESLLSPSTHLADAKAIDRLKLENGRLRAMNRLLTRNGSVTVEGIVEQFREELTSEPYQRFQFSPKYYPNTKTVSSVFDPGHEEVATLVLSDWHIGEVVRSEETNGVNRFNSLIAANRLWRVIDKFKKLVRGHQQMYRFKSVWIPVLGDMLNGSIHPEFILTNDLLDVPSAILAARLLIMAIHEIKTLGLPIELDCIVGNHPRLLAQMPAKRQAHLSLDLVVYEVVAQAFAGDEQVKVNIHYSQFGIVEKEGHRFVLEHGYHAKPDTLPERIRKMFDNPLYREATSYEGSSVDCVVIGDKHRAEVGDQYIVNGSLVGQGEYGVSLRLDPIRAVQQFFGVSKSHTRTFHYELDATGYCSEDTDNPMSAYTFEYMRQHGR